MDLESLRKRAIARSNDLFQRETALIGFRGSVAHGTYIPNTEPNSTDDIDLMSIHFVPADYYIGIKNIGKGTIESFVDEWDIVSYEFKKFVHLLIKSNPNVMSMLWMKDDYYISKPVFGKLLIDNRNLFTSKKAFSAYTGYAAGQLKKMTAFTKEGYMGEKRKRLVEKLGFDAKNASHCIRLLKQGIEYLSTGEIIVDRTDIDAKELIAIKQGSLTLEEIKEYAEDLFSESKIAFTKSHLPEEPNHEGINKLVSHILYEYIVGSYTL